MARDEAYRIAEAKIEEARRERKENLDLKGMNLIELPESLGDLTWLQSLDLSYNHLTTLPDLLCNLTKLQWLNLSSNAFAELPEALRTLKGLCWLYLGLNQLTLLPKWISELSWLQLLNLPLNQVESLPESLGGFAQLKTLNLQGNQLVRLPGSLGKLSQLQLLRLSDNYLMTLPDSLGTLIQLQTLDLSNNQLVTLPDSFDALKHLTSLDLSTNKLRTLPGSISRLKRLRNLRLSYNPLDPELAAAYAESLAAIMRYLRAKSGIQVSLDEAKLILVGEGEVGKSCLLSALRDEPWVEGNPTTHGIEIKQVSVIAPDSGRGITLNGWDFGGQRVYRPTHQLFFSAPAVYLAVWKPREGPQQGFVKEWIRLIKHREPDAKILVVATHGGPQERQPDIDRQEIWDLFGKDTVIDFFHVDSKPDEWGVRFGINNLKIAIARVADSLPEVGRKVPKRWQETREALQAADVAYLPLDDVLKMCTEQGMDEDEARLFVAISHRLGHLIHYEHDLALRNVVVLKPDWLATAISFVLDDKHTRAAHGLVNMMRLSELWNDSTRAEEFRYPPEFHPVFLRLMERFDLSYRVAGIHDGESNPTSLIAQLVPDVRPSEPDLVRVWPLAVTNGDEQQVQICRIVDVQNGQSATAEGLFYQLIVRLHKFSLGRVNHVESVHWQRGLVLDDEYNGRALLENVGNDVRITVRAPYPQAFLSVLTHEVKWLVESFWQGLRCEVMVPCVKPCGRNTPGTGLFEVEKLIESKRRRRPEYPCPICNEWQNIDSLLLNAPAIRPAPLDQVIAQGFNQVLSRLDGVRVQLSQHERDELKRFRALDQNDKRLLSQIEDAFTDLMQALTDEAKDGPRLFSLVPVNRKAFNPKRWTSEKFRLTLWCEHTRLPLPVLNKGTDDEKRGVYELELKREWVAKAAPFLKVLTGTLSLVLPVASSAVKLALDETAYKAIEEQLDFGQKTIEAVMGGGEKVGGWLDSGEESDLEHGTGIRAEGSVLRELHALLREKDPGFGGLVRVQNKRQEFLWVHEQYASEY